MELKSSHRKPLAFIRGGREERGSRVEGSRKAGFTKHITETTK